MIRTNRRYKKRGLWMSKDVDILLEIWRTQLNNFPNKKTLTYPDIEEQLQQYGVNKSSREIKDKLSNLKKKYYRELRARASGASPRYWPLFDQLHEILNSNSEITTILKVEHSEDPLDASTNEDASYSNHRLPPLTSAQAIQQGAAEPFFIADDEEFMDEQEFNIPIKRRISSDLPDSPTPKLLKQINFRQEILNEFKKTRETLEKHLKRTNELLEESNDLEAEKLKEQQRANNINQGILENLVKIVKEKNNST